MKLLEILFKIFKIKNSVTNTAEPTNMAAMQAKVSKPVTSKSKLYIIMGLAAIATVMTGFFLVYFLITRINMPKEPEFTAKGMVPINSGFANTTPLPPSGVYNSPQEQSANGASQPLPLKTTEAPIAGSANVPTPASTTAHTVAPTAVPTVAPTAVPTVASTPVTTPVAHPTVLTPERQVHVSSRVSNYDPFKNEFLKKYKSSNNKDNNKNAFNDMGKIEDALKETPRPVLQALPPPPPPIKKMELKVVVSGVMDSITDKYALTDKGNMRVGNVIDGYVVDKITHDVVTFKHALDDKDIRDVFVGAKKDASGGMP